MNMALVPNVLSPDPAWNNRRQSMGTMTGERVTPKEPPLRWHVHRTFGYARDGLS